jgi:hypothetical protein
MIPIRFHPEDRARGIGAVIVRDGYGAAYSKDVIWVRPSALEMLDELGIRYERVNGDFAHTHKKPNPKKKEKKSVRSR